MSTQKLQELSGVIEEQIRAGEDLLRNLASQREAILAWDVSALMGRIEERESRLESLAVLEQRRREVVEGLVGGAGKNLSLKDLLERFPCEPETAKLAYLRIRAREVYARLQDEEKRLVDLTENLLGHLREALRPLSEGSVHLYGDKGTAGPRRPAAGLIQGKV